MREGSRQGVDSLQKTRTVEGMKYPEYPGSAVELEESVLARWREDDLFRRTLEQTAEGREFVFYEGPPTANGRPGMHHVISRTIKDLVCRHQTMHGRHVTRIAGWDTHGLPVEIEAEKRLGISGKRQIEELGVARFNEVCRESVFTYKEEWERFSERIGYWLDYSQPYVTFEPRYIESVWNILYRLHEKGLVYRGHKSVPYCPRCGTALSSHEVAQGYEEVADPSLHFLCAFAGPDGGDDPHGRAFLVWTTTPWTLPSNVALAVHPELTYAEVEHEGRRLVLAEARVVAIFGEEAQVVRRYEARELVGQRYHPPFELLEPEPDADAWMVVAEDFVTAEDGTGLVHLAPAFGADDYAAGQRHNLPMFRPVDDTGRFHESIRIVGGMFVKDADDVLVRDLASRGGVFRHSMEVHTYPHCWRCRSPLLYMARDSWYVRTTAARTTMLSNNAEVGWHPPEVGSGRFGEWLEGNVDWAISRERYWGTPLPFWICSADASHTEILGSFEELRRRAGSLPDDFDPHKPYIDEPAWPCSQCAGTMRRTPEVLDVWFDSGAMPYAQWHYPFENQDEWRRHFPADFICEGVDQTRGWFYSLMAIGTMLGDGPAYRNVVVNDLLLDAEGQKMSKSRGNVVDPWEAIDRFGADAIRWYLVSVSQPWVAKRFDPVVLGDFARRTFDTLANTYRFFTLYANLESWTPSAADPAPSDRPLLDRWVLSRATRLAQEVDAAVSEYELTRAARMIAAFIADDLSNWYVRRSRDRFWGSSDRADACAAFRTLHDVLVTVTRLLAPFTPFHSDWLHRALTGTSVHLAPYADAADAERDPALERGMEAVRVLARLGRAARERVRIRVRQPLRRMQAVAPADHVLDDALLEVLRDELNVRVVEFLAHAEELIRLRAQPNFRVLGKRFGGNTQEAAARIRDLGPDALRAFRAGEPLTIDVAGESHALTHAEVEVIEEASGDLLVETEAGFTVALDTTIDEELRVEGIARELVNRIQRLRRDSGLAVSDRIRLGIHGGPEVIEAVARHGAWMAGETLAADLESAAAAPADGTAHAVDLDGVPAVITIVRA
jgi:isoleucyl-tRNA synthetase